MVGRVHDTDGVPFSRSMSVKLMTEEKSESARFRGVYADKEDSEASACAFGSLTKLSVHCISESIYQPETMEHTLSYDF